MTLEDLEAAVTPEVLARLRAVEQQELQQKILGSITFSSKSKMNIFRLSKQDFLLPNLNQIHPKNILTFSKICAIIVLDNR